MAFRGGGHCEKNRAWRSYVALPPSVQPVHNSEYNEPSSYESCHSWIKYAIYACNIVFLVVGVTTLAVGAWLRTDSRFREFLSERYRNVVEEAFWQAPTLYIFSYILIILGACMVVVSIFGCCGAVAQSRGLLLVYSVVATLLMLGTLSAGIYIMFKRDGIDVEVSDALIYMVQHYYQGAGVIQETLDRLQQTFRCCGNGGCSDFRVFRQDPPRSCDIRCDGCHYRIMLALRIGFSVAVVVFAIVVLLQLIVVGLSLATAFSRRRKYVYGSNQRCSSRNNWPRRNGDTIDRTQEISMKDMYNEYGKSPSREQVYNRKIEPYQRY